MKMKFRTKSLPGSTLLVILVFALLTVATWALLDQSYSAPDWPGDVSGLAFSPYRKGQDNSGESQPGVAQIDDDLALLAGMTRAVRTYTTEGVFAEIPCLAASHGLDVTVGAWLDGREDKNQLEIDRAIALAGQPNVSHVLIGNEVLLREELPLEKVIAYLDQTRQATDKPVSTAETAANWFEYPELAQHVDFIAVHILPYWEGISVEKAVDYTVATLTRLQARFPDKPIVIAEVGWPSEGRTRFEAVATPANQAWFLRQFLDLAEREQYDYFLMEAFDQPWKRLDEGAVGAFWGILDVERQVKFPFTGPINKLPAWPPLASVSILLAIVILGVFFLAGQTITTRGKALLSGLVFGLTALVAWLVFDYFTMYMGFTDILIGVILLMLMLAIATLMLTEAYEWVEAHWFSQRRRPLRLHEFAPAEQAMVSIHVPAYNEPPQMLIQTLDALANLDYDNYEVIVIDNNTQDENVWRPVARHCETLGGRFHFRHVDPLAGFKAGALNHALQHTSTKATIIAVIDSDYVVEANWLRDLVPVFEDPAIGIVQAPQDYRDEEDNLFKTLCDAEYRGFFQVGMVTRNERNAIIQHGTMTLIRRKALEQVGGWAEWSITEDAELGLRILEQGYDASYTPHSYGRGLIPDTFVDYKKQRYRWAYGAMQILKQHRRDLFAPHASLLGTGQRFHFIAGWLPWLAQSANLLFTLLTIVWSAGMVLAPDVVEAPHLAFSIFPILFFSFNLLKLFHLYRFRLKVTAGKALAAGIASLSLSHTIGKAMLAGLFTHNLPFLRTPKKTSPHLFSVAMASAFEEILLFFILLLLIFLLTTSTHVASPDFSLWVALLLIQSLPYGAALLTSVISACPPSSQRVTRHPATATDPSKSAREYQNLPAGEGD